MAYVKTPEQNVKDLRSVIQAKKAYSVRALYNPTAYHQVFGNMFVPNLSLIDLLFCEGPNAGRLIRTSQATD